MAEVLASVLPACDRSVWSIRACKDGSSLVLAPCLGSQWACARYAKATLSTQCTWPEQCAQPSRLCVAKANDWTSKRRVDRRQART